MRRGDRWSLLAAVSLGALASVATSTPNIEARAELKHGGVAPGVTASSRFTAVAHVDGAYRSELRARCCHTGGAPAEVEIVVYWRGSSSDEAGGVPQRTRRATLGMPDGPACLSEEHALDCAAEGCRMQVEIDCSYGAREGDSIDLRAELAGDIAAAPGLVNCRPPARDFTIENVLDAAHSEPPLE